MHPYSALLKSTIPLILATSSLHAEKVLVIGDSLSKEYEIEFPALYPTNPATWEERNWLEIVNEHRSEDLDAGSYGAWPDSRIAGHEYNWAFPGSQTSEWVDILSATLIDDPEKYFLRVTFDRHLEREVHRVVIFLGGNDLRNNYSTYYAGADPQPFINGLISNVREIVSYVIDQNDDLEVVLVNMPDVGATPSVQAERPDPELRQNVTDLTKSVNVGLRELADEFDIGYADIFSLTEALSGPERFVIGGVHFIKSVDPDADSNDPQYFFSPDGFHPNTNAQLLFANEIVAAFNRSYPQTSAIPLFSTAEMLTLMGIDPDVSYAQWSEAYALEETDRTSDTDGDGADLWWEFVFNQDPRFADSSPDSRIRRTPDHIEVTFRPRVTQSAHFNLTPQMSADLVDWEIFATPDVESEIGLLTYPLPLDGSNSFLRLEVEDPTINQ